MKKESFSIRLNKGLNYRCMTKAYLAKKTELNGGTINNYANGKYEPKQNNLFKIAQVLNVSEAWLMGYSVPMEKEEYEKALIDLLDEKKLKLIGQITKNINNFDIDYLHKVRLILDLINDFTQNDTEQLINYITFIKTQKRNSKNTK